MDIREEEEEVKKELLEIIIASLKENKMDSLKAKKLANDFLALLPFKDQQDLLGKLKNLGQEYPQAKEVYVDELKKISENKRNETLYKMREHIRGGNIDRAIETAGVLNKGS